MMSCCQSRTATVKMMSNETEFYALTDSVMTHVTMLNAVTE